MPKLQNISFISMWFQQDGAMCPRDQETWITAQVIFGRVISRFGDRCWPPRYHDLTPLDFVQVTSLCEQTNNDWNFKRWNSTLYLWNTAKCMRTSPWKFHEKGKSVPAKPTLSFVRCPIALSALFNSFCDQCPAILPG